MEYYISLHNKYTKLRILCLQCSYGVRESNKPDSIALKKYMHMKQFWCAGTAQ